MSSNIVVWCGHWTLEVQLSQTLGIDLFNGAEVIHCPEVPDHVKTDTRFRVALVSLTTFANGDLNSNVCYDLSWADLVICYNTEIIDILESKLETFVTTHVNNVNYLVISSGSRQNIAFNSNRICYNNQHWMTKVVSSNHFRDTRSGIISKPKMFDVLLGGCTQTRKYIFNQFKNKNLLENNIVNINPSRWSNGQDQLDYRSPELDIWEDPLIQQFLKKATTPLERYSANPLDQWCHNANFPMSMSSRISWDIYLHSWYSVVAETMTDGVDFITEKTVKPLFAKRIFVLFGSQHQLKNLQEMGFRTFSDILDESYDSIPNETQRHQAAWDQIEFLMTQDPLVLYDKVQNILDHNYNLIIQQNRELTKLKNFLAPHLPG